MLPHAEMVHWGFAAGILLVGLCLLAEAVVGQEVWRMRAWRKYLWPGIAFGMGVLLWPVMAFFTNSSIHMYAHGSWAEVLMLAGGAALAVPAVASAHATLQSTTPRFGHEIEQSPTTVQLHFDQRVEVVPGSIKVLNGAGKDFALPARVEGRRLVAGVEPLKLGAYTV